MPFPTNIQFYIDENILTQSQAETLSEFEITALNTPFARESILQGLEDVHIHMSNINSSRTVQVFRLAEAMNKILEYSQPERAASMKFFIGIQTAIDEGRLSIQCAVDTPIEKKFFLISSLFRLLIASGELGFDPETGLTLEQRPMEIEASDPFYSKVFALQTHIEQSTHSQALIQTINLQKLFIYFEFDELVNNGTLTIDELLSRTPEQLEGLRQLKKIVLDGSLYARP